MRYLDPKAGLTFKRVFGEHPDLVKSLLNALLPLEPGQAVEEIESLPVELVSDNPLRKYSSLSNDYSHQVMYKLHITYSSYQSGSVRKPKNPLFLLLQEVRSLSTGS